MWITPPRLSEDYVARPTTLARSTARVERRPGFSGAFLLEPAGDKPGQERADHAEGKQYDDDDSECAFHIFSVTNLFIFF